MNPPNDPSNAAAMVGPIYRPAIVAPICENPCAHPFNWRALMACAHERGTYRQTRCRECGRSVGPCPSVMAFIRDQDGTGSA